MNKVLLIININKDESMSLGQQIASYLKEKSYLVDFLSFDGFCDNVPFSNYKFVITLGGDGTVLYAARNCVEYEVPVFPINLGEFGFIATIQPCEWQETLDAFLLKGNDFIQRMMIKAQLYRAGKLLKTVLALNDVVISAKNTARTVSLNVKSNNDLLCKLKSDGVILSTPTGSTAYSASAGGPIVEASLDAFVLTPINSFSLSSRPIVLNPESLLNIEIEPCRTKEISMIVDGQEPISLEYGDNIKIVKFDKKIKLVSSSSNKFYDALRSKLNWTGGPHA